MSSSALDSLDSLDNLDSLDSLDEGETREISPADLRDSAIRALQAVADDTKAPAAARAQAARTLLEYAGAIGRHAKPPEEPGQKELSTMSRAELLQELDAIRRKRSTGAK